jgi:hypothetical protein
MAEAFFLQLNVYDKKCGVSFADTAAPRVIF